jgi:hypothetical protein
MLISTFNQVLTAKYPSAVAYIPQANTVNIIYSPNSKVYSYTGTILTVAEKLNLIPAIDIQTESQGIAENIPCVGYLICADTVRHMVGKAVEHQPHTPDEYGRKQVIFSIIENDPWL